MYKTYHYNGDISYRITFSHLHKLLKSMHFIWFVGSCPSFDIDNRIDKTGPSFICSLPSKFFFYCRSWILMMLQLSIPIIYPIQKRDNYLRLAGDFNQFSATSQKKGGAPLSKIILQSLPSAVQSEGTTGQKYLQEKDNFLKTMDDLVTTMMVKNIVLQSVAQICN